MSILPATETNIFRSPQEWIQRMTPPVQLQLTASSSSPLSICTPLQPIHDAVIVPHPLQVSFILNDHPQLCANVQQFKTRTADLKKTSKFNLVHLN